MSGLVIRGREVDVPGLVIRDWHDQPRYRLKLGEDGRRCGERRVLGIVCHTTKGIPGGSDHRSQVIHAGAGPDGGEDACARWWSRSSAGAGAHLVVDRDGSVACFADLVHEVAYHAGSPNNSMTVGVECYQDGDAGIWQATIDAWVILAGALCELLDLPKQIAWPYAGGPCLRLDKPGGRDYRGVYGHRDCDRHRGLGDPGDALLWALVARGGFEAFDVNEDEDLQAWRERQRQLNAAGWVPPLTVDGIPGPRTLAAWHALRAQIHNGYAEPTA